MTVEISNNYNELSIQVSEKIAGYINAMPGTLVCLAAGNTPLGAFRELVAMQERGEVDLSSVWYAGLDEWIGLGPGDVGSCAQVMNEALYKHISKERIRIFDGLDSDEEKQCRDMENWIKSHGGLGFTLLGIGMNGHIGFNEPGASDAEGCFLVDLDDITKSVSKKYFGKELPIAKGITIGWRTLFNAGNVVLMASGKEKAPIVKAALQGPVTPDIPATQFKKHNKLTVMLDKDAASLI